LVTCHVFLLTAMPPPVPAGSPQLFFMSAQVVDDPWGPLTLPNDSPVADYVWATKEEVLHRVGDARTADLLRRMLLD
jgi:hypothetical protein